jgi:hypothetical protein
MHQDNFTGGQGGRRSNGPMVAMPLDGRGLCQFSGPLRGEFPAVFGKVAEKAAEIPAVMHLQMQ